MIESFQNPKIKNLIRLTTDNRFRKKQKVFIIEGQQENERALNFSFVKKFLTPIYRMKKSI